MKPLTVLIVATGILVLGILMGFWSHLFSLPTLTSILHFYI